MKRTRLIAALVGLVAVATFAANASAMYNPRMGRFAQRDPGPDAIGAAPRIGTAGPARAVRGFVQRDVISTGQYADGMNLYQGVQSCPVGSVDPFGLEAEVPCAESPCQVKQASGPDGDGSFGYGRAAVPGFSPRRTNIWRYAHTIKTSGDGGEAIKHKVGHTWMSCGGESFGFYPKNYMKSLLTGHGPSHIPGLSEAGQPAQRPQPADPLEGEDSSGQQIEPDWKWKTEIDVADGRTFRDAKGTDKQCKCARCDDIKACVDREAMSWVGTEWTLSRHCQDFTIHLLSKCCMSVKNPPTMMSARERVKWWYGGGDAGRNYVEE